MSFNICVTGIVKLYPINQEKTYKNIYYDTSPSKFEVYTSSSGKRMKVTFHC